MAIEIIRVTGRDTAFALDSGVQRKKTHKFYFREGMFVVSFNFRKDMSR
jgi:hypothetical protein